MSAPINFMENIICPRCNKPAYKNRITKQGVCFNCYRKFFWIKKTSICPRCKRTLYLKSKGLCAGCYNTVYNLEYAKAKNQMKLYGLDYETYKKLTEKCVVCGFDKIVALHHLDQNKKNNSRENLVGLCPNHHAMLHMIKYREEIFQALREKGFNPQEKKPRTDIKGSY